MLQVKLLVAGAGSTLQVHNTLRYRYPCLHAGLVGPSRSTGTCSHSMTTQITPSKTAAASKSSTAPSVQLLRPCMYSSSSRNEGAAKPEHPGPPCADAANKACRHSVPWQTALHSVGCRPQLQHRHSLLWLPQQQPLNPWRRSLVVSHQGSSSRPAMVLAWRQQMLMQEQ